MNDHQYIIYKLYSFEAVFLCRRWTESDLQVPLHLHNDAALFKHVNGKQMKQ